MQERPSQPPGTPRVECINFTDPFCSWCWAAEPVRLRLLERYGHVVHFSTVLGGLVPDAGPVPDPARLHWLRQHLPQVAAHSGQPIDAGIVDAVATAHFSTWPACIHAKAAYLQSAQAGDRYLRRLRIAAMVECRNVSDPQTALRLADVLPELDGIALRNTLADGEALQAFRDDQAKCRRYNVQGFPTVVIHPTGSPRGIVLVGHRPAAAFEEALRQVLPGVTARAPAAPLVLLARYGALTTRELAEIRGVPHPAVESELKDAIASGLVVARDVARGKLWSLPEKQPPQEDETENET
jgi:putative protein-disulfide isomerase